MSGQKNKRGGEIYAGWGRMYSPSLVVLRGGRGLERGAELLSPAPFSALLVVGERAVVGAAAVAAAATAAAIMEEWWETILCAMIAGVM